MTIGNKVVEIDPSDYARLNSMIKQFPRETYKAIGRVGSTVRGKMRAVMRSGGGVNGVPVFAGLSKDTLLRRKRFGGYRGKKPGGILRKSFAIQMFRKGKGALQIGFVDGLRPYAEEFQKSQARQMEKAERRMFYIAGADKGIMYNRPARPVLVPFTRYIRPFISGWLTGAMDKILDGKKTA
jgi:hypothetical protein